MANTQPQVGFWSIFASFPIWEVIRIFFIGGPEYAEKRIPELLARLVASHQDENLLAGLLSDWLRNNFVNEDHIAIAYGIARFLRNSGGRFMLAAAEAIEALPATAHELRQTPAIQNAPNAQERSARFGAAMSDKFNSVYGAAKNRLQHTPIPHLNHPLGGPVSDPTSSPSTGWFGGITSGLGDVAGKITEVAHAVGQFVVAGLGICAAYLLLCVVVTWNYTNSMDAFAWGSFYLLTGVPIALAIIGLPFGKHGTVLQFASLAFLVCFSSSLVVIAFALAVVSGIIVNNAAWGTVLALIVVTLVWWVCWAIAQKVVATPGFFIKFVPKFVKDLSINKEEGEELAAYWRESNTIDKISVTVAGAIYAGVLLLTIMKLWQQPLPFLQALGLLAVELLIGGAFIRMSIKLSGEQDYPPWLGLKDVVKKWMHRLYTSSMATAAAILIVIALIIGGASFLGDSNARGWWSNFRQSSISATEYSAKAVDNGVRRTADVVSNGAEKAADYTEEKIDRKADHAPAKAKASAKAGDCKAFGGAKYCADMAAQGMANIYPCPCE